jgi:hypothetical protein
LQQALSTHPQYNLTEADVVMHSAPGETVDEIPKSFWSTYKPILLVFVFIIGVTALAEVNIGSFIWDRWMRHFMAAFFLVFAFFKLLDLRGFAMNYLSYDIIAKRWFAWGYVYAFIELTLGILFFLNAAPLATNIATVLVIGVSSIGVVQSLLAKRRIRCACLGAVFNLPMSTITLVEDALMVVMSGAMIIMHYL